MRYAQIKSGVVSNVIDAAPGKTEWQGLLLVASETAEVGDGYDGVTFTPRAAASEPPPQRWVITSQAFFDRLASKEFAIRKAAVTDPDVAAVVQMADARASINLASGRMAPMLAVLVGKGLITTAEADAAGTTPPADAELFHD